MDIGCFQPSAGLFHPVGQQDNAGPEQQRKYSAHCAFKKQGRNDPCPVIGWVHTAGDGGIVICPGQAKADDVKIRSSYNLSGISFTPAEIADEIKKHIPDFTISYKPDFRQKIADSWPASIDDSSARNDWGWKHEFEMDSMTKVMLENLRK